MSSIDAVCADVINTLAHDCCCAGPVPGMKAKGFSRPVKEALAKIAVEMPVILVTGRPWPKVSYLLENPEIFHAVTEHGSVIYENGKLDEEYLARLRDYTHGREKDPSGWLWMYTHQLPGRLFAESRDCLASFSVHGDNWSLEDRFAFTKERHPHNMQAVLHEDGVDVIPPNVSKCTGVEYLLSKLGIRWDRVAYLGDDESDNSMLSKAAFPVTHATATAGAKALVLQRKGYISAYGGHRGADDMLRYVGGLVASTLVRV